MEERIFVLIFCTAYLLYALYRGYFVWFKPKQFLKQTSQRRLKVRSQFRFLPKELVDLGFLPNHPLFFLWFNRVLAILFLLAGIFAMIHLIRG